MPIASATKTLIFSCAVALALTATTHAQTPKKLIDPFATTETKALFQNLDKLSNKQILFGHQHATEYGHGWTANDAENAGRSDVKSVVGTHPAVVGVDISGLSGRSREQIEREKTRLRGVMADTYNRGGLTTISWHFSNPVTPTGFQWSENAAPAVKNIIPGGSHHEQYKAILIDIADLAKTTKGKDGSLAPLIFRPYHEFDGGWFWWGASHCTREEFIALWRFTVGYLRDNQGVHNFVYTFSPDCTWSDEAGFLDRYPGDEWVDMVGMDNYADFGRDGKYNLEAGFRKLKIVSDVAKKRNKLAAFTETGLESIPNPTWWTESLLKGLKTNDLKLTYALVWRNDQRSATHYYAPFAGHSSAPDFVKFYNDDFTVFENDLPPLYKTTSQTR
ncbi:MAG TPA: glycosyl hydrolase [Abditibacterium sp.]